MIICQNCKAENSPESTFCYKCGRKLEIKRQHECGYELSGSEVFCPRCGKKITPSAAAGLMGATTDDNATVGQKSKPASAPVTDVDWDENTKRRKLIEIVSRQQQILREHPIEGTRDPEELCKSLCNTMGAFADQVEQEVPPVLRDGLVASLLWWPLVTLSFVRAKVRTIPNEEIHPRFHQLVDEQGNLSPTATDIGKTALEMLSMEAWLCEELFPTLLEPAFKGKTKELQEIYLQTMRERFFLDELTVALKKRFVAEEQIRLDHGYYASEFVVALRELQQKLLVAAEKAERDVASHPPGFEKDGLLALLAPLSSFATMEDAEKVITMVRTMGLECPFKYDPLTPSQDKSMDLLLAEGLRGTHAADILSFLEGLRTAAGQNADTWLLWYQAARSHYQADQALMTKELEMLFELNHVLLTRLCNVLSRRIRSAEHEELPFRALNPFNQAFNAPEFRQKDQEFGLTLFPQWKTVGVIAYEQALARKNALKSPESQPPQAPLSASAQTGRQL
jgi:hypothetical protein